MSINTLDHPYHQSRMQPAVHTIVSLLSYHHSFDVVIHLRRLRFFFRRSRLQIYLVISMLWEFVVLVFTSPAASASKVPSELARPFCARPRYSVSRRSITSTVSLRTYLDLSMMFTVLLTIVGSLILPWPGACVHECRLGKTIYSTKHCL